MFDLSPAKPITGSIEFTQPEWLWLLPILLIVSYLLSRIGKRKEAASLVLREG